MREITINFDFWRRDVELFTTFAENNKVENESRSHTNTKGKPNLGFRIVSHR